MPRFKKGDKVRITSAGTIISPRFNGGLYDVEFHKPNTWDETQSAIVYEGDLVRAKAARTVQGCQERARDELFRIAKQTAPLRGMTLYINIQTKGDCISGHGDAYEDDIHPPKKDPDDADEPLDHPDDAHTQGGP